MTNAKYHDGGADGGSVWIVGGMMRIMKAYPIAAWPFLG